MNGNKYVFLLAALLGVILWNTPNTVPLLVDSHSFYIGSAPCTKCHGDIQAQLAGSGTVTSIHRNLGGESGCRSCHTNTNIIPTPTSNTTLDGVALYATYCSGCHGPLASSSKLGATATMIQTGITSVPAMSSLSILSTAQVQAIVTALSSNSTPAFDGTYHSAFKPNCIDCHQDVSSINNYQEAHSLIVNEVNRSSQNVGLNEACILCHTTLVNEVVVRNRVVFPFENDSIAANGSVEYNGTYTTTITNPEPTGLHNFYSGVQCFMCHAPVQDILNQPNGPYPEHNNFGCTGCHRGNGMNAGNTTEAQINYHAAKIKYCSDCHDLGGHNPPISRDCNRCHESHGGLKANWSV